MVERGERMVSLVGDGMRRSGGMSRGLITKFIVNTNEGVNPVTERLSL